MNQKTKYYLNLSLIIFLLIIYIYDAKYVRRDIEIFETAISDIDMQLEAGSEVINDMNQQINSHHADHSCLPSSLASPKRGLSSLNWRKS